MRLKRELFQIQQELIQLLENLYHKKVVVRQLLEKVEKFLLILLQQKQTLKRQRFFPNQRAARYKL
jgi:hypothetical protein